MNSLEPKPQADWSHLDEANNPAMVDVSAKAYSRRTATALAEMWLPPEVASRLIEGEIQAPKGPVFHTAIIAGTMAAKQTSSLIPFCHPLPLEGIHISIEARNGKLLPLRPWRRSPFTTCARCFHMRWKYAMSVSSKNRVAKATTRPTHEAPAFWLVAGGRA